MAIFNIAGRIVALILGIIGSIIALIEVIVSVSTRHIGDLMNPASTSTSHGFLGTLAFIIGIVGSLIGLPFGEIGAILLAIAGLLMLYVTGWAGIIPFIFLIVAAVLMYLDRGAKRKTTA